MTVYMDFLTNLNHYTPYSPVFVKNTVPFMLSYLLLSQLNIPLTIINMVVEYFQTCKKHFDTVNHNILAKKLEHY